MFWCILYSFSYLILSPSSKDVSFPSPARACSSVQAIVDLPAPLSPVNHILQPTYPKISSFIDFLTP